MKRVLLLIAVFLIPAAVFSQDINLLILYVLVHNQAAAPKP
jgi:hypothetical protein